MRIIKFDLRIITLLVFGILFSAGPSAARITVNPIHFDEGKVTAINLRDASVTVGSQVYRIDEKGPIGEALRSKSIQVSDPVVITYEIQGTTKRLISISKKSKNEK
ncbi:hypothetical protein DESC_120040 [Desulfosarcina cetonica]|uniref:hypothetical protein n=1 Tax=Desulfosarcina cetonica TaxID=90730 RepID=UPI0006D21D3F|nr:hypothetical protein [Desulfosarcina cetonica]VTR63948.1 hypothetical protein DESC_120040 [Desulfosarcina cetonica]